MPAITFMKEAVTSFRQLGTFLPTQSRLARDIARSLPHRAGVKIVELGAGEGSITRAIVEELGSLDYRFLVIETNENLLTAAQKSLFANPSVRGGGDDPSEDEAGSVGGRLSFLEEDAFELGRILDERDMASVDAIVSSLPLAYFSQVQRRDLFALAKDRLVEEGIFVQYRYTPKGIRELQPFFGRIHRRFVLHMFPAWLFVCHKGPRQPEGGRVRAGVV